MQTLYQDAFFDKAVHDTVLYYSIPTFSDEWTCGINANCVFQVQDSIFENLFNVQFYPNGDCAENEGYISLYFDVNHEAIEGCGVTYFTVNVTLTVVDMNDTPCCPQSFGMEHSVVECRGESKEPLRFGIARYIKRETLHRSKELLPEDWLKLRCDIQYRLETSDFAYHEHFRSVEQFQGWFIHETTLDAVTGESINIHSLKVINPNSPLWAALPRKSRYFKNLLAAALEEGKSKLLPLNDLEYQTFCNMACFVVCGHIKQVSDMDEILDLYVVADRDEVLGLKEQCTEFIKCHLTGDRAAEILSLADLHNDIDLKEFAIKYILANWDEVTTSYAWSLVVNERKDLANEVIGLEEKRKDPEQQNIEAETEIDILLGSENTDYFDFYQ